MHEMSLAESVIGLIERHARMNGSRRIKAVRLEIGKLSGVKTEAMRFCFDAVAGGTLAEGAKLDILKEDGRAWCFDCRQQIPLAVRTDSCPECGNFHLRVNEGTAMRVKKLEIE